MIPQNYIAEWSNFVFWQEPRQIEQDLIITNALLRLYNHSHLKEALAFRGGTALNKLFFNPPTRYSEDIDLVQIESGPVGNILNGIREVMDDWLGSPRRTFSEGRTTLVYRTEGNMGYPLKLKIEINCREHFSVLGMEYRLFESVSSWAPGKARIKTYKIEELLGTKMRALYQRRKGRDLFDLYMALITLPDLNYDDILKCFNIYTNFVKRSIPRSDFKANIELKLSNPEFHEDIIPLLPNHAMSFNADLAYELVREKLIERL